MALKSLQKFIGIIIFFIISSSTITVFSSHDDKKNLIEAIDKHQNKSAEDLLNIVGVETLLNDYGNAAIHVAVQAVNIDFIKKLITLNASINKPTLLGNTPLHQAVIKNSLPMTQLLITHGSNVNAQNTNGATALHLASTTYNAALIEYLLNHHADPNVNDFLIGTPLFWVIIELKLKNPFSHNLNVDFDQKIKTIKLLADNLFTDINQQDPEHKKTALMFLLQNYDDIISTNSCSKEQLLSLFKILIKPSLDLSLKNSAEKTIYDILKEKEHIAGRIGPEGTPLLAILKEVKNLLDQQANLPADSKILFKNLIRIQQHEQTERCNTLKEELSSFTKLQKAQQSELRQLKDKTKVLKLLQSELAQSETAARHTIAKQSSNQFAAQCQSFLTERSKIAQTTQAQKKKNLLQEEVTDRNNILKEAQADISALQMLHAKKLYYENFLKDYQAEFQKAVNAYPCPNKHKRILCVFLCNNIICRHKNA